MRGGHLIIPSICRLLVIVSYMSSFAICSTTNLTDQLALLAFKSQITFKSNGSFISDNWNTGASFCNWTGVSCSRRHHHRVIGLNLSYMNIQGLISPHIGNLSFLTQLNLRNNSLYGQIPETIGRLRRLRVINLRNNHLEGFIPSSISRCQRLQSIILGSNLLQGTIPSEIGNLLGLEILHLAQNNLSGSVPSNVFNISTLRVLDLQSNEFVGGIPTDICYTLPKLELLYLSFNPLGGPFPTSLCHCKDLREIVFIQNNFTGIIPNDIGCLSKLEYFVLSRNLLTGTIPTSLGNLSRLEHLDFIDNFLSGEIPQELSKLSRLQYLRIAFNRLSGRIPGVIFNMSSAGYIDFMNNYLSGNLPQLTHVWLPNLGGLNIQGNGFTGSIPNFISNASRLTFLELSRNSFSGSVPISLGNLRFLKTLNLQNNRLSQEPFQRELRFLTSLTGCRELKYLVIGKNPLNGELPNSIGNLSTSLELFSADLSQIRGTIPITIGDLGSLTALELASNDLTGLIPSSIGSLNRLQRLRLYDNKIEGPIPDELCRSSLLWELLLHENKLSGPIPTCIGSLSRMQVISISSNKLTSIPVGFWNLRSVWFLNMSLNSLTERLSSSIGDLTSLQILDLSKNQLSGSLPREILNLKMLQILNLSENSLQGSIPDEFDDLGSLESLDLSSNYLTGLIPRSMEKLQYLKHLNISLNMLTGEVPVGGRFRNFTAQSFMGNDKLCGGIPEFGLAACPTDSPDYKKLSFWMKYIVPPIGSGIVLVALFIVFIKYRKKNSGVSSPPINLSDGVANPHRLISYYELLRATNNFNEENLIGVGSFGCVYKARMSDGEIVAVKVINLQVEGALKSFDAECQVLRNVRHRNLVKIISSCTNNEFRALILEYMPNASLEKWLYSSTQGLDLIQMLNIMVDVALAVEYLHYGYSEPVVHCDLKPSNVLLDQDMNAHVGDFGLAKVLAKYNSMMQTTTLGTMGYIAPEYGSEGRVSTKGDVYSYGIMLMEIFTGKKPTDEMFVGGSSLRKWVSCSLPDLVMEVVDPNLLIREEKASGRSSEYLQHCLLSIMELALLCSTDLPEERPSMKNVVVRLQKIKQQCFLVT